MFRVLPIDMSKHIVDIENRRIASPCTLHRKSSKQLRVQLSYYKFSSRKQTAYTYKSIHVCSGSGQRLSTLLSVLSVWCWAFKRLSTIEFIIHDLCPLFVNRTVNIVDLQQK